MPPATITRPLQVYALAGLWALKGFQSLLTGIIGTGFYVHDQITKGALQGYGLQLALQSVLLSAVLAAGSFYVMAALWLGRRSARTWGVLLALLHEAVALAYLLTRPPEFGGEANLIRTVTIDSVVNLGIIAVLLFDVRIRAFLGDAPLIGWWAPKR